MRRIIANTIVSLDGYSADGVGNPLVLNMDGAFDRANREDIEAADVILLGRTSFDGFSAYWPSIAEAPEPADPDSPEGRALDADNRAISRAFNRLPKVVVSDRDIDPANAWASTTTRIGRGEAVGWARAARRERAGTVIMFASGMLRNTLLAEGLIDELHLMVSPISLGTGTPALNLPANFDLLEARTFEDSTNVQLRYRVNRPQD